MGNANLETAVQVVTIVGGVGTLVLAALQAAKTWLDIGEKRKKREGEQGRAAENSRLVHAHFSRSLVPFTELVFYYIGRRSEGHHVTADDDRRRRLEKTVAGLQQRFGVRSIRHAAPTAAPPVIATGFPALDEALGIGGLPLGRLSEIAGVPTSGMATLALKILAEAQAAGQGSLAAYVDVEKNFDPDYAARCGVVLERLLVIRPYTARQALPMLPDLALNGGLAVLVVDAPLQAWATPNTADALAEMLARIVAPLNRSGCALLFLSGLPPGSVPTLDAYPAQVVLPHYAAVRLLIRRERWLYHRRDVAGYAAQVQVVKNRLAAEGKAADVAITFDGDRAVVRGEGLV